MSAHPQHRKPYPLDWQSTAISVVSLGCGTFSALTPQAITAIQQSQIIFGSAHHFDEISTIHTHAEKIIFPSPFQALAQMLDQNQSKKLCVLASGDALYFGVGSWLKRTIGNQNLHFFPNISAIQACFHQIGQPWQNAQIISLHGRPFSTIRRHLVNQQWLAILTDSVSNPIAIANELVQQGLGESELWVCEAMGSKHQKISKYKAQELQKSTSTIHNLNICLIKLIGTTTLPAFPGIADALFSTGSRPGYGMISKREVRLTILSLMQPTPNEIAWDIGAGCGSVSVEWARWNQQGQIFAIESSPERIKHIKINADRFGTTQNLNITQGKAPQCCDSLPQPNSIFIGGSNGLSTMLDYAWQQLKPGGKLTACAVTDNSRQALTQFMSKKPQLEQIEIQITKNLPDNTQLRTLSTVLIMKCIRHA